MEVDETSLCGKKRKKGQTPKRDPDDNQPVGRSGIRKSMVAVAIERGGRARAAKGRTHRSEQTIAALALGHLDIGQTVLVSDDLSAYHWIGWTFPAHLHVNHLSVLMQQTVGHAYRRSNQSRHIASAQTVQNDAESIGIVRTP